MIGRKTGKEKKCSSYDLLHEKVSQLDMIVEYCKFDSSNDKHFSKFSSLLLLQ
jgi:hypothetical protein